MKGSKICIITVNYKSYRDVLELADSIVINPYQDMSFIVVDNSEDESEFKNLKTGLEEIFSGVEKDFSLIRNDNTGYAGGNNLGIKFAIDRLDPEYIWLLNPDTVINDNTPSVLVKTTQTTKIPVATCKMIDHFTKKCQYDGRGVYYEGTKFWDEEKIFKAEFLSGANIFMEKEVIEKVGYMEEKFFLYFEDNEYFERMLRMGIHPVYTSFTSIYHKGSVSTDGFLKTPISIYYYVRNLLHWTKENSEKGELYHRLEDNFKYHILTIYQNNIHKQKNLISLIKGVSDFFRGVYGKFDIQNFTKQNFDKVKLDNIDTVSMEHLEKYLYSRPRDIDNFILFFKLNIEKFISP